MEKVDERDLPHPERILRVVVVQPEEVSIVAGRDLRLHLGNGERRVPQLLEDAGEIGLNELVEFLRCQEFIEDHILSLELLPSEITHIAGPWRTPGLRTTRLRPPRLWAARLRTTGLWPARLRPPRLWPARLRASRLRTTGCS